MTLRIQIINKTALSDVVALDSVRIMLQQGLSEFEISGPDGTCRIVLDVKEGAGHCFLVTAAHRGDPVGSADRREERPDAS